MKTIASGLLALVVLAGSAAAASAADTDCRVKGWTDGSTGRPIFTCPTPR